MKPIDEIQQGLEAQRKLYRIKSFLRRGKRRIADFLPMQYLQQKPDVEYSVIRKSETVQTYLPKLFGTEQQSRSLQLAEVGLYGCPNYRMSMDSTVIISPDLETVYFEEIEPFNTEFNILYNTDTLFFHSHKLVKFRNWPYKRLRENTLFLGGTFTFNYFHFFLEILSKTEYLNTIKNSENLKIAVSMRVEKNENLKTLLSFFVPMEKVIFLEPNRIYQCEKLWHITYPNSVVPNIIEGELYQAEFIKYAPSSIEFLRKTCREKFDRSKVNCSPVARLFFGRKSVFRQYNEDETFEIAKKYGFEKVYLEDFNIHEQMFLIANAEYILGPSGAAWTNMLFCTEGKTKGLLWLQEVWTEFSAFSTLAVLCGVDLYQYQFETPDNTFHGEYKLPLEEFERQLQKLMEI